MVQRKVILWLCNGDSLNKDEFDSAVENAKMNLKQRYGVILTILNVGEYEALLKLNVPNNKNDNFDIGKHLKGISTFLTRNYGYRSKYVGKRLFNYKEINIGSSQENLTSDDKIKFLQKIMSLLECNDFESNKKLQDINTILNN